MPKINQEEYEILKGLDDKWKWIARDDENQTYSAEIYVFEERPKREDAYWNNVSDHGYALLEEWDDLFQFIQWEDEEPYNIAELIEEYEDSKEYKDSLVIEYFMDKAKESEEKEVKKDIEWAKKEIKKIHTLTFGAYEAAVMANNKHFQMKNSEQLALINKILEILNQLDEPEVLSQEFIDKYKVDYDNWMPAVPIVHLQNLLVPKQEELEVKIQELIEDYKQEEDAYSNPENGWIGGFIEDLKNLVEEEQKYYAKIKGHENIYSDICFWIYDTEIEELLIDDAEIYPDVTAEYMIKATKDEWANLGINDDNADFVKVEEIENE